MIGATGASRLACSLLLLALFPGAGGARPPGGLDMPGTGGAPPTGDGPGPPDTFPTIGADRSFVTAFFKGLPLAISERRAPYSLWSVLLKRQHRPSGINSPFQLLLLAVAREGRREVVEEAAEGLQRRPAGEEEEVVVVASQLFTR